MPMMVRMYQAALVASSSLRVLAEPVLFFPSTGSRRRELDWVWLKASWGVHLTTHGINYKPKQLDMPGRDFLDELI